MILRSLFGHRTDGFYVDVGAHHPTRFSNTRHFYEIGWHGINIDADSGAVEALRAERPRDVNIHLGVGTRAGRFEFTHFEEPALSTFENARVEELAGSDFAIAHVSTVEVRPIRRILGERLGGRQAIDFLAVDVEGRDLDVLQSNDWSLYRPKVVLVECLGKDLAGAQGDPTVEFLASQGYSATAKTVNTVICVADGWRR